MKAASLRLFLVMLLAGGAVTMRAQSAIDGFDPNANNVVLTVVLQPDGKILLGGSFSTLSPNGGAAVTRNRIARLNPDGTLDTAFNPNASGGDVNAIALQADGKILIGGFFTALSPNGGAAVTRNRIARLNPDGTLDNSFDPNASGSVRALAVQPDGKILVGGQFATIGGAPRNRLARLDPATGTADSFDPNANNTVFAIVVQPDGKILAGGNFNGTNSIGGQTRNRIARLDPSTGLADDFNPNATGGVFAIALQADGRILTGGSFNGANSIGGQARNRIARLDPSSGLADGFNPNANFQVSAIVVQPDGKILVGGDFNGATGIGGAARNNIARLDPVSGAADGFDPKASNQASVFAIGLQPDGKVVVGGNFTTIAANGEASVARNHIVRLETDGRLDRTLNLNAALGTQVRTIAVQPDGKILIGGIFNSIQGVTRNKIARLNNDGTLDLAFNPNANGLFGVTTIAVQADGKILVGGDFNGPNSIGGQFRDYIARLDPTTGAADSWNPRANQQVSAIVVQPDGKVLVGGSFSGFASIGGEMRNGIARLDPVTGQADSFNPNANASIISIALQTNGKVLVGGRFTEIGGQPRNLFARLEAATGQADSFNPAPNNLVIAMVEQGDGKIVVGGSFDTIGGHSRNTIARLDPITGLADSYDPNINGQIVALALQSDGKILAAGSFSAVGTAPRLGLARLDPASGAPDTWEPKPSTSVTAMVLQPDGKVLAGGSFTTMGGETRNGFARLSNDTAALQDLVVAQNSVTWIRGGASPQFARVRFESSTDNIAYAPIGEATRSGTSWNLAGLNLPIGQNIYVRARGHYGTGAFNGGESIQEAVQQAFFTEAAPTPGLVANVSTRLPVGTDDNVLIEGFIVQGPAGSTKKIMVRAIGPSLAPFGIADAVENPTLEVRDAGNALIASNNDWRTTQVGGIITGDQAAEIEGSGLAPSNNLESAIVADLAPGSYTAIVRGVNNTVGTGVVDAYDLSPASPAKLANIATRGLIQPGDKLMIAGFITQNGNVRAVVRAIGPSLSAFGINNALSDTTLQLRDQNGTIVKENDDWESDPEKQQLIDVGLQPSDSREAAVVAVISPGQYTVQVRGKPETTGIGVVQVFFLE